MAATLEYVNEKEERFRFKDQLLTSYETIIKSIQEQHENLVFQHYLELQRREQGCPKTLTYEQSLNFEDRIGSNRSPGASQLRASQDDSLLRINHKPLSNDQSLEVFANEQFKENQRLRIKMQEMEDQLVKYKKYILMDKESYERVLRLEGTYCKQAPDQ